MASEALKNLAANMRIMRERRKLTQTDLATQSKVSLNTIRSIETMGGSPSWTTIELLAEVFGVKAASMMIAPRTRDQGEI